MGRQFVECIFVSIGSNVFGVLLEGGPLRRNLRTNL
jgi:hypothetical protein